MKYCPECGEKVMWQKANGTQQGRFVCNSCRAIFFQSPRLIASCIAEWEDKILLCRRGTEPGYGSWTLPAGFLEISETAADGARREVLEETGASVEIGTLYALFNLPAINQAQLVFRAHLLDPNVNVGHEMLDARLFGESEIPWDTLAFMSTLEALRHYFRDRKTGEYRFLFADIMPFL
ncbi:MAG TPA: NUDIX hydrolase [Burkholderiales bacterium]|jgi:ADP-ribose pyrophosphatase YjhB (NUDIX family)|nr:NUDIX hydrolase [Burkholderiales bacterium]